MNISHSRWSPARPAARQEAQATVARITGELAGLVDRAAAEAAAVVRNARRSLRSPSRISGRAHGRLVRAVNELEARRPPPREVPVRPPRRPA